MKRKDYNEILERSSEKRKKKMSNKFMEKIILNETVKEIHLKKKDWYYYSSKK